MFALYGMNKLVFALVFAVGFVSPALQIVGASPMTPATSLMFLAVSDGCRIYRSGRADYIA